MRRRSRGTAALGLLALVGALLATASLGGPAGAHTPHDDNVDVAISPDFATDQRVWTLSQGLLLRSDDGGATWTHLQPGVPSLVTQIEVAPGDASVLYLTEVFAGVHRSHDGGDTWEPAASSPDLGLRSLVVSPVDPATILVTTASGGTAVSTDGGDTWTDVPAEHEGDTVAFGAEAALLVGDEEGRVHRSVDDGRTWTTTVVAPGVAITALAAGGDEVVYAGTADGRVHRSDDDGRTFAPVAADGDRGGLPAEPVASIARSPGHATDGTVWASMAYRGAYRSTDRGATWEPAGEGLTTDVQADVLETTDFRTIVAGGSPDGAATLFLAGFDGLFRSTDGGDRWQAAETLAERIVAIAVSPDFARDRTVAVATYLKGPFLSTDAGETWQPLWEGLEQQIDAGNELVPLRRLHGMAFSPDYARDGTLFSATWLGFVSHRDGRWREVRLGQVDGEEAILQQFTMGVHPDGTVYLANRWGEVRRAEDPADPASWEVVGQFGGVARSVVVDPVRDDVWVATSTDVFVRRGATGTFEPTGLDGPASAAGWFGPDEAVVFAGTDDGLFATRDGGRTWERLPVLPDGMDLGPGPHREEVVAIGPSPDFGEDGLLLVSLARYGLFRSTDGGATFEPAAPELLADHLLVGEQLSNATSMPIAFSPDFAEDGTVFAHTSASVLRSTDRGRTWDAFELPTVFDVLAATMPEQLDRIATPPGLEVEPVGLPRRDHGGDHPLARTAAWAIVAAGALGLGVAAAAVSRPRRRG